MKIFNFHGFFVTIAIIFALFTSAQPALADIYQIYDLGGYSLNDLGGYPQGTLRLFDGMTPSGAVEFYLGYGTCFPNASCYGTWIDGVEVSQTSTEPYTAYDNGTPCTVAVPAKYSVFNGTAPGRCNNGHEIFWTFYFGSLPDSDSSVVFDGLDPGNHIVFEWPGDLIGAYLDSSGDFVLEVAIGQPTDPTGIEFYEGIDLTTRNAPEPGSLLLLGTGALAAFVTMRRRIFYAR